MASMTPADVSNLRCVQHRPDGASLEWNTSDPSVAQCEVEVLRGEWWQRWEAASFVSGGEPKCSGQSSCWSASVSGLSPGTCHDLQVRSYASGSYGPWCPLQVRTSGPPAAPYNIKCVSRLPNQLSLSWQIVDPEGAEVSSCDVQLQGLLCWTNASFGQASSPTRASGSLWTATVSDLAPNCLYILQVRGRNVVGYGEWSLGCQFKTSEPPSAPCSFRCLECWPTGLYLEWELANPEGAEVTACDLQVGGSVRWAAAAFKEGAEPHRAKGDRWCTTVAGLAGGTAYGLRVRGRNAAGEGLWLEEQFRTSDYPANPRGFQCTKMSAHQLQLVWEVDDPEGAEVLGCEVWVSGSLSWQTAAFLDGFEPRRDKPAGGKGWCATVCDLAANTTYNLKVRGRNAVGVGPWLQEQFQTSLLPAEPFSVQCTSRTVDELVLQWQITDPEGAEVSNCEVQLGASLSWAYPVFKEGHSPRRLCGELWEANIVELIGNTTYEVRIRGQNAGGDGRWLQHPFKTSAPPPEPTDLCCCQRWPSSMLLQWQLEDPEGAKVSGCDVFLGGSLSWASAAYEKGKEPERFAGLWRATVTGLAGSTSYEVKVRGRNAAGDGHWSGAQTLRTSDAPREPSELRCSRRTPDRLVLDWQIPDPEGAEIKSCEIQQYGSMSWAAAQLGEATGPQRKPGSTTWQAMVVGLAAATTYDFRVRACNEAGEGRWGQAESFKTSEAPAEPSDLQCTQRLPDRLELEWKIPDFPDAEVTSCEVQVASSMSWAAVETEPGVTPLRRGESETWYVMVVGLAAATTYGLRVRGCNAGGEGAWSATQAFRTSETPDEPFSLRSIGRLPQGLLLEWRVPDPAGAPVQSCQVQLYGSLSWIAATLEPDAGPSRKENDVWAAKIIGLTGATSYDICIRGCNASGDGRWSPTQQFQTSQVPSVPSAIQCIQKLPCRLAIEWHVSDPEGAEVTRCEVQIGSLRWAMAELEDDSVPVRKEGCTWGASIIGLTAATAYDVRIRGCNVCGEGAWSQGQQLRTSDVPSQPTRFRCTQRLPDRLQLEWEVADPEGAEVLACDVQVCSSISWTAAMLESAEQPLRTQGGCWRAVLVGLQGNLHYDVRVRGRNDSGCGGWSQGRFMTSELPDKPLFLRCLQRLPNRLVLTWQVVDPEGSAVVGCEVEVQGSVSWAPASLEGGVSATRSEDDLWTATVTGLQGASTYQVRVRGCNSTGGGKWLQKQFQTTDPPAAPTGLRCLLQFPRRLDLEWNLANPDAEGANITSCEVQVCSSVMWEMATYSSSEGPVLVENRDDRWRASITGLPFDSTVSVRVRGCNTVGAGAWCLPQQFRTLVGKPDAPFDFQCAPEGRGIWALTWQVSDPEDLQITHCEISVLVHPSIAAPYWEPAKLVNGSPPARLDGERWGVSIRGLDPDTSYTLAVYGCNMVCDGKWLRKEIRTHKLPDVPKSLKCTQIGRHELALEWEISDPEGAAITACEVQLSGAVFWKAASLGAEGGSKMGEAGGSGPAACREEGTARWHAVVVGLSENANYNIRVCGRSAAGDGPWAQGSFKTAT